MRVWDLRAKHEFRTKTFTSSCMALDVTRNDTCVATGHKTGEIKLWSLSEVKEVQNIRNAFDVQITCLKFTPDCNKIVASAAASNELKVICAKQGIVLFEFGHEELLIPNALAKFGISPDGKLVVISNNNGALFFFNL